MTSFELFLNVKFIIFHLLLTLFNILFAENDPI